MKKIFCLLCWSVIVLSGCVSYEHYYKLDENYLARRQLETRRFETQNEELLLISSAQVLQDLGFCSSRFESFGRTNCLSKLF